MTLEQMEQMAKDAVTRFEALTPEQQAEHRCAQRKSWVIGNMLLDHPEMTREHATAIYDSLGF